MSSWRQFTFFDSIPISDPLAPTEENLFGDPALSATSYGSSIWILGKKDGVIQVVSKDMVLLQSFYAYENEAITYVKILSGSSMLLTVAEGSSTGPLVKLWDLDSYRHIDDSAPKCITSISIKTKNKSFPISAFAANSDFSVLAFGFSNGSVTLVRGDIIHDRGSRQRIFAEVVDPVTGLAFYEHGRHPTLYISTINKIMSISTSGKYESPNVLEETGCDLNCMTLYNSTNEIVVARNDALYFYNPSGRTRIIELDGHKKSIYSFNNKIAIVFSITNSTAESFSSALNSLLHSSGDSSLITTKLTILDIQNKFVSYSSIFSGGVRDMFFGWSDFHVLGFNGVLYRLHEYDIKQKVTIFLSKDLYLTALDVAKICKADDQIIKSINKSYGDFLYNKGQFHEAMLQYIQAMDLLESSEIIRKYLDSQNISDLTLYLQILHDKGKSNTSHTTLLLTCYAIQKDEKSITSFIQSANDNIHFDFEKTMVLLRDGGFSTQAAILAERFEHSDLVVDILILDLKMYNEAIHYLRTLIPEDLFYNLNRYGRVLIDNLPNETTSLYIEYYTQKYSPQSLDSNQKQQDNLNNISNEKSFSLLNLSFLQGYTPYTFNINNPKPIEETKIIKSFDYHIPNIKASFPAFVASPRMFVKFLEACLLAIRAPARKEDINDLYTTLFDMYLQLAQESKNEDVEKADWINKAKALCKKDDFPKGSVNVVVTGLLSSFDEMNLLVKDTERFEIDLLRSALSSKNVAAVLEVVKRYGSQKPEIYTIFLHYCISSPDVLLQSSKEIPEILKNIRKYNLMTPLQIIQTLGSNSFTTIGLVREFLIELITTEKLEIENNKKLASSYREESKEKLNQISKLKNNPQVFHANRCSACGGSIDLPVTHFLCHHSYHQHCLNDAISPMIDGDSRNSIKTDNELHCPKCFISNTAIKSVRKAQIESANRHELFKSALKESNNKFKVISDYYGRGILDKAEVYDI